MDVGSVASSANSATISAEISQSRQAQQAQVQQSAQQPQQSPGRSVDESEAANRARAETEASRATVNANGQTVGRRVNTTA